jgi:glycerophosphoryl diester phosphodiesterase
LKIVCHRGACLVAPENTFAAADAAIARGAAFVEFDVRRTRDGVHVVMHDRDVARTTDGSGLVDEMDHAEIARLDAGAWFGETFRGQPVPRLEDFLRHLKGRTGAYCEVKRGDCAEIARMIREAGLAEETFFFAFKPDVRAALREAAPEMRHMITREMAGTPAAALKDHGAAVYEFTLEDVDADQMEEARALGLATMIFEPGADRDRLARLREFGPDYANIDDPDFFAAAAA